MLKFPIFLLTLLLSLSTQAYFYPKSYTDSREHWIEMAIKLKDDGVDVRHNSLKIETLATTTDLTTDSLYIPQNGAAKKRLVIITGGIHGIEAYTGSALQFEFLKASLDPELLKKTGFLFIHAVNPFGFYFNRRVSENNVDLNRNFSAGPKQFSGKSESYQKFDDFLNPTMPLDASRLHDLGLFTESLIKLARYGKKQLTQIVVGGQYQNPNGIYYGGQKLEPNVAIIKEEFLRVGKPYEKILHLDLHTGYGKRGELHFFSNRNASKSPGFKEIFTGFEIDYGDDKDFYETSGSFDRFTVNTFPKKQVIPMTLEFGTMDSQTIMGGFYSLRNMIYENQGFHHGYTDKESKQRVEKIFSNMFNPSDKAWRDKVMKTGLETYKILIKRFVEI